MGFWATIGDICKTAGLGSILGVVVGASAAGRQKHREAFSTIQSQNYREIIELYKSLQTQLLEIRASAHSFVALADSYAVTFEFELRAPGAQEFRRHQEKSLTDAHAGYLASRAGVELKETQLVVYRNSAELRPALRGCLAEITALDAVLRLVAAAPGENVVQDARRQLDGLYTASRTLATTWDAWNTDAERRAAGFRCVALRRNARRFLRGG